MKRYMPLAALAVLLIVPHLGLSTYVMHLLILFVMWSVIGMSWNLLAGYCGQVSFGHAAFFGVGAYTSGLLFHHLKISAWWGMPLSIMVVGAFTLLLGFICLRLRGPFFALGTLAVGEILRIVSENMDKFTHGDLGITMQRTWVDKTWYYYIIIFVAALSFFFVKKLMESRLGYYFVAIREDQDAAESLGINTTLYKTVALTISGIMTGMAGAFYMNYMGYIDPKIVFALHDISIISIMVVMVGGVATYWGPAVGAGIMVLLSEFIRSLPGLGAAHQTLFGILLIVIIIFLPNGIVGDFGRIKGIFIRRRAQ